jgi:hypothetical protein
MTCSEPLADLADHDHSSIDCKRAKPVLEAHVDLFLV